MKYISAGPLWATRLRSSVPFKGILFIRSSSYLLLWLSARLLIDSRAPK